jgi:hypothetical protein
MFVVLYWSDGTTWDRVYWPIKHLDDASAMDDLRGFTDLMEIAFPATAIEFAIGCAGYVGGEVYVDVTAKA